MANPCDFYINGKKMKMDEFLSYAKKLPHSQLNDILGGIPSFKNIPTAPFVTDTNAWTKLALKVALKEAVKQGADKIAWTTGEQQVGRYEDDFRKQVDKIETESKKAYGSVYVIAYKNGNVVFENDMPLEGKTNIGGREVDLEDVVGKEIANKIRTGEQKQNFEGKDLTIGGKGMKGFYGSPTEGSLGIVGNVAKSLFKQEPKTVEFKTKGKGEYEVGKTTEDVKKFSKRGDSFTYNGDPITKQRAYEIVEMGAQFESWSKSDTTQHSIDITPELKEQVSEGLPLFMASAPKEDFTEALNEYDNLIKNPKGTTEYIKKFGLEKIKKIKDITSNFGTYIAALEKSNYITKKIC
jgi:hypothetical protein